MSDALVVYDMCTFPRIDENRIVVAMLHVLQTLLRMIGMFDYVSLSRADAPNL